MGLTFGKEKLKFLFSIDLIIWVRVNLSNTLTNLIYYNYHFIV